MTVLTLTADRDGMRADAFLSQKSGLTRSAVQRLLARGAVTSGSVPVKKNAITAAGQVFLLNLPEPEPIAADGGIYRAGIRPEAAHSDRIVGAGERVILQLGGQSPV